MTGVRLPVRPSCVLSRGCGSFQVQRPNAMTEPGSVTKPGRASEPVNVRVNGVEEAVACANDNEFGLSAAVFGRDVARAWHVAGRIESGICHVNGPTVHDEAQMPFGGVKASGYGRFGGKAGIDAFTELRWITVQTAPRHYPF